MTELEKCPFCGGHITIITDGRIYVKCKQCGAQGPSEAYPSGALEGWGRVAKSVRFNEELVAVLKETVAVYGKAGGPWNVPNDPGGWLERARAAIAKAERNES